MRYVALCLTLTGCTVLSSTDPVSFDPELDAGDSMAAVDVDSGVFSEPVDGAVSGPDVVLVGLGHTRDAGTDAGTDAGVLDGTAGNPPDPVLPTLCEPCDGTCADGLVCADFGAIGHKASEGEGSYCVPSCDTYFPGPMDNPECLVFDDYRCIPSIGACRPYGYNALDGIREQCGAFLAP